MRNDFNQGDNQYSWFLLSGSDDINTEKNKTIVPLHWKTLNKIKRQQEIE
ncbi:hypothetical protein [Proteus myxofaciens]|nr:hypothetical protein [Proteus myxofaciens]